MQPPTGPIEISDPNNVPEVYVSGPFNIMNVGGMVHITFTTARPNPNDLLKGSTTPEFQATVACRLLMPMEIAQQLTRTLADTVIKASHRPTPGTATKSTDKSDPMMLPSADSTRPKNHARKPKGIPRFRQT
jgi:hypothetical protein